MVFAMKICNPYLYLICNQVLTAQMFKKHPKQLPVLFWGRFLYLLNILIRTTG